MTYGDNPRKVYGKVKIVYADGEISKELNVETSGTGISQSQSNIYGIYFAANQSLYNGRQLIYGARFPNERSGFGVRLVERCSL